MNRRPGDEGRDGFVAVIKAQKAEASSFEDKTVSAKYSFIPR